MADVDDEVEGLDVEPKVEDPSSYPLDDVMVRSETRTVGEIIRRVQSGRYAMNPDFQRDFVWPRDKQSKLIESCVMRIPLPVFYVAEGVDGRVTVVDGLQRLSTFRSFLAGELKLQLGSDHPLDGATFEDLPINLQERIEDTQLTLYILDKNAPETARLDIFERVNSGVPLTRQQMRNALYNGKATQWLAERAQKNPFLEVTGRSLQPKTMRDREAINRFCAFYLLGWNSYTSGDMDDFLARALKLMNQNSDDDLDALKARFVGSMKHNKLLFGPHAFRKSLRSKNVQAGRSVINIALFDVLSVGLARVSTDTIEEYAEEIVDVIVNLLDDADFVHAITYSTNSTYQVQSRFRRMESALEDFSE